jgi:hypothetical protein
MGGAGMAGLGRRGVVVGDREVMPADQAVVLIRRRAVRNQAEQARATSTMLVERCLRAVAQSLTVRGQAAEGYADARNARQVVADRRRGATTGQDETAGLDGFQVQGLIDGQPVGATLTCGRLICDPALRARAELLVDLQEVFSDEEGRPRYVASLEGPEVAVALTLLRACDRVAGLSLVIPMRSAADRPDQADAATP